MRKVLEGVLISQPIDKLQDEWLNTFVSVLGPNSRDKKSTEFIHTENWESNTGISSLRYVVWIKLTVQDFVFFAVAKNKCMTLGGRIKYLFCFPTLKILHSAQPGEEFISWFTGVCVCVEGGGKVQYVGGWSVVCWLLLCAEVGYCILYGSDMCPTSHRRRMMHSQLLCTD